MRGPAATGRAATALVVSASTATIRGEGGCPRAPSRRLGQRRSRDYPRDGFRPQLEVHSHLHSLGIPARFHVRASVPCRRSSSLWGRALYLSLGERRAEIAAQADLELGERVPDVHLDGLGAEEELLGVSRFVRPVAASWAMRRSEGVSDSTPVRKLRANASRGRLTLRWGRVEGAKRYIVRAQVSDRRRLNFVVSGRSAPRGSAGASATMRGVAAGGREGPAGRGRLRKAKRPRVRLRP